MLAETAHNAGVITNEEFAIFQNAGYMGLYGGLDVDDIHTRKQLEVGQKILHYMGSTEIMCHPSSNEQEMDRQFRWGYHGESELQALLSTTVKEKIDEESIDLISYRDVAIERIS